MARQLRIEYTRVFYHATSRGNEKKRIYNVDKDKEKFLAYLRSVCERFRIIIHAYCLMPNHYHLLMETPLANLSRTMQFINSSYTTCCSAKRKASGHLFQGRRGLTQWLLVQNPKRYGIRYLKDLYIFYYIFRAMLKSL